MAAAVAELDNLEEGISKLEDYTGIKYVWGIY